MITLFQPSFDEIIEPIRDEGVQPKQEDLQILANGVRSLLTSISENPNNGVTKSLQRINEGPYETKIVEAELKKIEGIFAKALSKTSKDDPTYWIIENEGDNKNIESSFRVIDEFPVRFGVGVEETVIVNLPNTEYFYQIRINAGIKWKDTYQQAAYIEHDKDKNIGCHPDMLSVDIRRLSPGQLAQEKAKQGIEG